MAVPVGSDFQAYNNFPEVYHGGEISKAAFSGVQHRRGRGKFRHNICGVIPEKSDSDHRIWPAGAAARRSG